MELYKRCSRISQVRGTLQLHRSLNYNVEDVPIHTSLTQLERTSEDAREKTKREKLSTMTFMGNFCPNIIYDTSQF